MNEFYTSLSFCLEKWSKTLDGTEVFTWMALTAVPDWEPTVKPSLKYATERIGPGIIDGDLVFDELHMIQGLIQDKFSSWADSRATSEARWMDIVKTTKERFRPINALSSLVQYAFAIPGSST